MSETSPWDGIGIPGADVTVRLVDGKTAVPCFWGRAPDETCLFIIELQGDHSAQFRKNVVIVNGVAVDLRGHDSGQQHLVLTLEKQVDLDLFAGLCRTLASALVHASDSANALTIALNHIRRWKNFLSGRSQRLSAEEIRGLFAELVFLLELIDRKSAATAIAALNA